MHADRIDQLLQAFAPKFGARLQRCGHDIGQQYLLYALAHLGYGRRGCHARIDERAETFAESDFCHKLAEYLTFNGNWQLETVIIRPHAMS